MSSTKSPHVKQHAAHLEYYTPKSKNQLSDLTRHCQATLNIHVHTQQVYYLSRITVNLSKKYPVIVKHTVLQMINFH